MSDLTSSGIWELEVRLVDYNGSEYRAYYKYFKVDAGPLYNLQLAGYDSERSNISDSLLGPCFTHVEAMFCITLVPS